MVLFQCAEEGELLRIACEETKSRGLRVRQESAGELTAWCFDESFHVIELTIPPAGTARLCSYYEVTSPAQLVAVLGREHSSRCCLQSICSLLRWLGIEHSMAERSLAP